MHPGFTPESSTPVDNISQPPPPMPIHENEDENENADENQHDPAKFAKQIAEIDIIYDNDKFIHDLWTNYGFMINGKKLDLNSHISIYEASFIGLCVQTYLNKYVKDKKASLNVLEVGLAYGTSIVHILNRLLKHEGDVNYTIIDPNQSTQWKSNGINTVRDYLKQKNNTSIHVNLMEEYSQDAMAKLTDKYDIIFIDGAHEEDIVIQDLMNSDKILKPNGIMIADDVLHFGVKRALNRFLREKQKYYSRITIVKEDETTYTFNKLDSTDRHIEPEKSRQNIYDTSTMYCYQKIDTKIPTDVQPQVVDTLSQSQRILDEILERVPKNTTTLNIDRAMNGKLVFNFESHNLNNIETIDFSVPGKVESIFFYTQPTKLRKINLNNQNISRMNVLDVPNLEELNLSNNNLNSISLKYYPNLKIANLANNKIVNLANTVFPLAETSIAPAELPRTLSVLNVNNNRLTYIDLLYSSHLTSLNATGNPDIKIVNRPLTLKYLLTDNALSKSPEEKTDGKQYDYEKSLHMYYTLKTKYENLHLAMLDRAYTASNKNSRKFALESVRPLCIQCQRPVGTLFIQKKNHKLYARCGDPREPCNLNITIFTGVYTKVNDEVELMKPNLENSRELIIRHKMDTLFKYMSETESAEKFKLLMDDYDNVKYHYNHYLTLYNETYFSEVKKQEVIEQLNKIYDISTELNLTAADDNTTGVISKYIESYLPEQQQLRELKYEVMEMIKPPKKDEGPSILYQNEIGLERITHIFDEKPHVISFVYDDKPKQREERRRNSPSSRDDDSSEDIFADIPEDISEDISEHNSEDELELISENEITQDIFDFNSNPRVFEIMSRHYQGLELYLRTAIYLNYLLNYKHRKSMDQLIKNIEKQSKTEIDDKTELFHAYNILLAWYEHFAPEKLHKVDSIYDKRKTTRDQTILFNDLYRIYVDPNWRSINMWFT